MKEIKPEDYGLDRFDLLLDPAIHATIYAGRKSLIEQLKRRIDRAFMTGSAMHTILWGPYGVGKTHTLYYLVNYIKNRGYQANLFHLTCPSFTKKSVVELYQAIIMSFGQKFLFRLIEEVWNIVQPTFRELDARTDADKIEIIDKFISHRDFSSVILSYQKPSAQMPYLVWKWLSGEKCSAKEKETLGVITDNSEPANAIHTLLTIIETNTKIKLQKNDKTMMILMIDELEQLEPLGDAMDFRELFRRLAEQKRLFVMLLAYTAGSAEQVPVLNAPPVRQRLGFPHNYIAVTAFDPGEAKQFIAELFSLLRPKKIDLEKKVEEVSKVTSEKVTSEFYPFTEEAIEALITKITASGEALSPRTIEMALTMALGDALTQKEIPKVITSEIIGL
mgnify:CR=1 FL=1